MRSSKVVLRSAVVLYFVMGLEILIMISPAAGFFYAAFNPFLLSLAQTPATRWLTAFFFPHMVSPPSVLLKAVRVAGSVLFVAGTAMFLVCAGQVYYNKLTRQGVALRGLYTSIRHPQYLGLAMTGIGLSILWPRFLVIALWALMVGIYYFLAKDEERRMVAQFGEDYAQYAQRTGMFLPRGLEAAFTRLLPFHRPSLRVAVVLLALALCAVGGAFAARSYTVSKLPLWSQGPVTALALLPNDRMMLDHRMAGVLELPEIKTRLERQPGRILVYFMPKDYVMQGMIADTGEEWQLYKRRHTFSMIGDWIFHPFRHLEGGHAAMHAGAAEGMQGHAGGDGTVRRLIFVFVETPSRERTPADLFAINARRSPLFVADVDIHSLALQGVRDLPLETGWGQVPTPWF
jgi:protein-S-isoprenylcysteine O-methyltransferase Ste14